MSSFQLVLTSAAAVAGVLVLAWATWWLWGRWVVRLANMTRSHLDDAMVAVLRWPAAAAVALAGLYGYVLFMGLDPGMSVMAYRVLSTGVVLTATYAVVRLAGAFMRWYVQGTDKRQAATMDGLFTVFQFLLIGIGAIAAIVVVLDAAGLGSSAVVRWLGDHGWRIALVAVLGMATAIAAGRSIPRTVASAMARRTGEADAEVAKRSATLSRVLAHVAQVFVLLVASFMVLSELSIDIAPVLAGLGVVGVALGFGAQSLIRDLLGGVFVILENQYRVGDVVKIGGVAGLVEDINLRRTVLRDLDGAVHFVPNGEIRVASNLTREWARVNLNVSVAYKEDLDRVISVVNRVGRELAEDPRWAPHVLKAPAVLRVDDWAPSGVELKILGDTRPASQWDVTGELRRRLKRAFDEAGIEIPWPHLKVFFGDAPFRVDGPGERNRATGSPGTARAGGPGPRDG